MHNLQRHTANITREPGAPWSIHDAVRYLGISQRHLRRLVNKRSIGSFRLGRRVMIPDAELRRIAAEGA